MNEVLIKALAEQFQASLAMLESALQNCPEEFWCGRMWDDPAMPPEFSEFWYVGFHALFWLDFYLSGAPANFTALPPFTISELDPAGKLPPRQFSRAELLVYLAQGRRKGLDSIAALTEEKAAQVCTFTWGEMTYLGLLIDVIRHNQEHGAQLNMFLGQQTGKSSDWVTKPKE
jgi:hypothetical protein